MGSHKNYPAPLRRIRFYDADQRRFLVFLSNYFQLPALTMAQFNRARWQGG